MKNKILFLTCILFNSILFSQTTLSAGDIAIIQYNADNPSGSLEVIKFVTLKSLETGTVINFTDHGWESAGSFRENEGVVAFTATRDFYCGEVITMIMPSTDGDGFTLTVIDTGFALATGGDQIIAFQGNVSSPTLIFAINNEGSAVWQSDATTSNTSALPTGLTNESNAVALTEVDNAKYDGSLSGSKAEVLSSICDESNWAVDDSSVITFSGAFNTTWVAGAWDGSGSGFLNTTIDDDYDTSSDGNFEACNCTVNSGKTITVNSGGTVKVDNDITNNGSIVVESGGSVVQVLSSGTNTGSNYTVERESTSQSSYHVFTYWSAPITSATFAAVSPSTHLYYSFNASSQAWVEGNSGTAMNPGIGYALEGPDTGSYPGVQTASFTGAPFNNGDISVGLSYSSDGDADNDWNLVGNPYPSAIDADTFLSDNSASIGGTIYFWTHNTDEDGTVDNTEDDYAMYNGTGSAAATGGVAPDGNIASAQGFFAQAISSSPMVFTNSMRISGSNTSFFKSKIKQEYNERDRIWLNLTTTKSFSQILVGFIDGATDGVDRKYDGVRFLGKTSLNFYSLIDDVHYGIQGKSSLKEVEVIPLGFSADKANELTISINNIEGRLDDSNVFIEDTHLSIKHNLKDSDYVFTTTEAGEFNNRFNLIIEIEASVLDVEENIKKGSLIIKNSKDNLVIETLNNSIIQKVIVYNLLGKQILLKENNSTSIELKLPIIKSNSILIVKTFLENGEVLTDKIYKN